MTKDQKSVGYKTIIQQHKNRIAFLQSRMISESRDDRIETLNEINYCQQEIKRIKKGGR